MPNGKLPFHSVLREVSEQARKDDGVVRIGITGTRNLDATGREALTNLMAVLGIWCAREGLECEVIQGGCIGADAWAGEQAASCGFRVHTILPEDRSRVTANWTSWTTSHEEGGTYRERNKRIVQRAAMLFVVADYPEDHGRSKRSGTWATARMAAEAMKPLWRCVQHDDD